MLSNCNDDDPDIDNDGIDNFGPDEIEGTEDDDNYIGGTNFNGLSTNSHPSFSNGVIYEDEFGNIVSSNNLSAGTYTAYAIDSDGCQSNIEEFTIASPLELNIELEYDYNNSGFTQNVIGDIELLCYGDEISIVPEITGGVPNQISGYIFECTDQFGNLHDITETFSSGSYSLTVYDDLGCEASLNFFISNAPEELMISYELSLYNDYNISCNGEEDGFINISPSGGLGSYTYQWSNGSSLQNLDNLEAGLYTVNITDDNGCVVTESIELIEPALVS